MTPVPRVLLFITLAGPAPSGDADTSRRCQGCSHPSRQLPGQAALSFTVPAATGPAAKVSHLHSNHQRLAAHADPGTTRRRRGLWPRTTDPWTASTNPVCAEPIRTPARPATPSTGSTPDDRPSTASTNASHQGVSSPTWPRSTPRSGHRRPPAAGPAAAHRPTRPDPTPRNGYATAEPFQSPTPGVGKAPCWTRHQRLPTQFGTASLTPPHSYVAAPTPPTRHVHRRSTRSLAHAE